ncbi:hypothetical protein S245_030416, partial [Arachis hypogaea]
SSHEMFLRPLRHSKTLSTFKTPILQGIYFSLLFFYKFFEDQRVTKRCVWLY